MSYVVGEFTNGTEMQGHIFAEKRLEADRFHGTILFKFLYQIFYNKYTKWWTYWNF